MGALAAKSMRLDEFSAVEQSFARSECSYGGKIPLLPTDQCLAIDPGLEHATTQC